MICSHDGSTIVLGVGASHSLPQLLASNLLNTWMRQAWTLAACYTTVD